MKIFALLVLCTLFVVVIGLVVFLAMWPGKVAHERNHPYADAISIGGWIGILTGGVIWPFVIIWAYATPSQAEVRLNPDAKERQS